MFRDQIYFFVSIEQLFLTFLIDKVQKDIIPVDGCILLFEHLEIDPMDPVVVVFSYRLGAPKCCEYTRDIWIAGMKKMK